MLLGAAWQRCRDCFLRNVLAQVPKGSAEMVAATIYTIFAQPGAAAVREQLEVIAGMLGCQFPKVEAMLHEAVDDITAFAGFPLSHWKKIWSTNPLEIRTEGVRVPLTVGRRGMRRVNARQRPAARSGRHG